MKVESKNNRIVEMAHAALCGLVELIPQDKIDDADKHIRTLEHTLNAYSDTLNAMKTAESHIAIANDYVQNKIKEIWSLNETL